MKLWYRSPAERWIDALPIGNGRLGVMVFGGVYEERIQTNEDTLWSGVPYTPENKNALSVLPEIRKLILEKKYGLAQRLAEEKLVGNPRFTHAFMPAGDLIFRADAKEATPVDYVRELDLETGVVRVSYSIDGVNFSREAFASFPDQVIVVRFSSSRPGVSPGHLT